MKKTIKIIIFLVALLVLVLLIYRGSTLMREAPEITSFAECIANGGPILESYPRQCKTPDGKTFTENIGNELDKADLIRINSPRPNESITSPLTITGEARGYWFFEASFPIELQDESGNIIAQHYATAQTDWMTENFVSFSATLSFTPPSSNKGTLILRRDNPSGLPENDDELIIPVIFGNASVGRACVVTGCSGQICAESEIASTCEYKPEYACYKDAICEQQATGECGWTSSDQLQACLSQ